MLQHSTKVAQFQFVFQSDAFCERKKTFVISYPEEATSQARLYEAFLLQGGST